MSGGKIRSRIQHAEYVAKCERAYQAGRQCYGLKKAGQSFEALWNGWTNPQVPAGVRKAFMLGVNDA